jgi:hypothetical protein
MPCVTNVAVMQGAMPWEWWGQNLHVDPANP